jgi:predicted nucleic acid-binding protein
MSRYIVDTSIVIQRLIVESHTPYVIELFYGIIQGDELIVPEFCLMECANVLWKHVRFQGMSQSNAESLIANLTSLPLTVHPVTDLLVRGLQVGLKYQLAVYDSIYIALAEKLSLPLITVDVKQEAAAKDTGITLKSITDFTPPIETP